MADDSDSDWEDVESGQAGPPCPCLFCDSDLASAAETLEHCASDHGVDILQTRATLRLDFYSCVKLINYIRREHPSPGAVLAVSEPPFPWEKEEYLQPVVEGDPLLQYDFEGEGQLVPPMKSPGGTEEGLDGLKERLEESERKAEEYKMALSQALTDMESMRVVVKSMFSEDAPSAARCSPVGGGETGEAEEEDDYFSTYTHFSIHEEMLKDEVRTESYKLFTEKNPQIFQDKVVLDIGCGTGILSMFAARAGARVVFGVDQSNILYKAMDIVRENGLSDKITLIKGRVEEVELPVDKVDVIISEWMGYFLLFESMLDTVLFARDKWLKDPTQVFPNTCSLSLVAMGNKWEWESRVEYWEDVYGFKMSCMKEEVFREAHIQVVDSYSVISSSDVVKKFDVGKVKRSGLEFTAPFSLTMQQDATCHGLVGYFDIGFDVGRHSIHISTSPQDVPTHWKQTVFYFKEPFSVCTGDLLQGTVTCRKNRREPRGLDIGLQFERLSFVADAPPIAVHQTFSLL